MRSMRTVRSTEYEYSNSAHALGDVRGELRSYNFFALVASQAQLNYFVAAYVAG
jgi:hypothetical protein